MSRVKEVGDDLQPQKIRAIIARNSLPAHLFFPIFPISLKFQRCGFLVPQPNSECGRQYLTHHPEYYRLPPPHLQPGTGGKIQVRSSQMSTATKRFQITELPRITNHNRDNATVLRLQFKECINHFHRAAIGCRAGKHCLFARPRRDLLTGFTSHLLRFELKLV